MTVAIESMPKSRRRKQRMFSLSVESHEALDQRRGDASRWIDALIAAELLRLERAESGASTGPPEHVHNVKCYRRGHFEGTRAYVRPIRADGLDRNLKDLKDIDFNEDCTPALDLICKLS